VIAFRFIFGALMVAAIVCFGMSIVTRDLKWRRRGIAILTWTVVAAVGFFGLLLLGSLGSTPAGG
jgi:uncharacterized membrane protein YecN with MAPEG domain